MENNIDPYKILGLSKNFTSEQLRDAYKKMALQVHPDKGGTEYLFKLVTLCYRNLAKEYKKKKTDKQYTELKSEFVKTHQQNSEPKYQNINIDYSKSFNIEKFNNLFDQNKIESVTDTGYGDFLKSTKEKEQKNIFADKRFTSETFNKIFDKQCLKNKEANKFVVKYSDPEPLSSSKKIAFTELGVDTIDDFSGDNQSRKTLNYMDLKLAHTTNRIVDPSTVDPRKQYRNIEELETDRGQVSYTKNEKERLHYEKIKTKEEISEKRRIENLLKIDNLT
jgi:curved DNA-binding protein CbpA